MKLQEKYFHMEHTDCSGVAGGAKPHSTKFCIIYSEGSRKKKKSCIYYDVVIWLGVSTWPKTNKKLQTK